MPPRYSRNTPEPRQVVAPRQENPGRNEALHEVTQHGRQVDEPA